MAENFNRLSRVHERYRRQNVTDRQTDDRQTDGRATANSEREREFTFAKKLLNSNIAPTCPYNMVNFSPLAAEIGWRVWGTPANFNQFRVLAALLHDTLGISQILRR